MDLLTFCDGIKEGLKESLNKETEISYTTVEKNNGVEYHSLIIRDKESNIAPTIHLDGFFDEYESGRAFEMILDEIREIYETSKKGGNLNFDFFDQYENVRERVCLRVVNFDMNKERLENLPYVRFLDLAIVFYFPCKLDNVSGAITITNEHLKGWKVTTERIYLDAYQNTKRLHPCTVLPIFEVLKSLLPISEREEEEISEKEFPMYVMSNAEKLHGAVGMFFIDELEKFSHEKKSNLYILPSSIHELILVPENALGEHSKEELKEMVVAVNENDVCREEQLSNHVYYYDSKEGQVRIA